MRIVLLLLLWVTWNLNLPAQQNNTPSPIIFIYDASGSMWGKIDNQIKMQIAAEVLSQTVDSLPSSQAVGLVAYGHREKGNCEDVEFLVETENNKKSAVIESLKTIKPKGKTPLAYSAQLVINKLKASDGKATIILITDGIESCGGNLCDVIKAAKEKGIEFRLHVVGFGLGKDETENLRCAAEAGDGNYYDAGNANSLSDVLNEATNTTVDEPAGNFSIFAIKNGEPVDAHVEVKMAGDNSRLKFVRTYKDTAFLYLTNESYDIKVTPLEQSDVNSVYIKDFNPFADSIFHKTVSFDGGTISAIAKNNGEGWDAVVRVYQHGTNKSITQGRTYGKEDVFELNPGLYDLEFKPMQIKGKDVSVKIEKINVIANQSQNVEHNFKTGRLKIGATSASGLVDAVVKVDDVASGKNVASSRTYTRPGSNPKEFILLPGSYIIKLKALGDHKGKTAELNIKLEEGRTVEKIHNF